VLNDLQAEFGTAPAAEERERQNAAQQHFLSSKKKRADFSCYNVTPLPRTVAPPLCLPLDMRDSLKEGLSFFLMGD
jgi:hypothetical protein